MNIATMQPIQERNGVELFDATSIFRRILVPIDFSDWSRRAVATATDLQARYGSELHFLTVTSAGQGDGFLAGIGAAWGRDDTLAAATRHLRNFIRMHGRDVVDDKTYLDAVFDDDIVRAIVTAADEHVVTLVVLASHRRGAHVLRTRTERVTKALSVPVLTIQTDLDEPDGSPE